MKQLYFSFLIASVLFTSTVFSQDKTQRETQEYNLHEAIYLEDLDLLKRYLAQGSDLHTFSEAGLTPLYYATQSNQIELVKALIDAGADVNNANQNGWTPLMSAVLNNHYEVAELLIQAGADVNKGNHDGWAPLHLTVNSQDYQKHDGSELISLLVSKGANINQQTKTGQSALYLASINNRLSEARLLIEQKSDINLPISSGKTPLIAAVKENNLSVAKVLIQAGADLNHQEQKGETALHFTVMPKDEQTHDGLPLTKLLIDAGANLTIQNDWGATPAYMAATNEHNEVLLLMIESKADINIIESSGWSPLLAAIYDKNFVTANALLKGGANANQALPSGQTSLHLLVNTPTPSNELNAQLIDLLVSYKANVNAKDEEGNTPIMFAILHSRNLEFASLLKANSDTSLVRNDGKSLLHMAIFSKDPAMLKLVLKTDVDLDLLDEKGWGAIHYLVKVEPDSPDASQMLEPLLKKGANPSLIAQSGYSPLMIAANFNRLNEAKLLIKFGADLRAENLKHNHTTASDYAYLARNIEMAILISKALRNK